MRRLFALAAMVALGACATVQPGGPQRFVVFFQEFSAQLDDAAKGAISASAVWAKDHPNAPVTVIGFAAPNGSPQSNIEISRLRAQVVTDTLVADGVDPARIQRKARGATDFSMNGLESRRVEISLDAP